MWIGDILAGTMAMGAFWVGVYIGWRKGLKCGLELGGVTVKEKQ